MIGWVGGWLGKGENVLDELFEGFDHVFDGGLAADAVAVVWLSQYSVVPNAGGSKPLRC